MSLIKILKYVSPLPRLSPIYTSKWILHDNKRIKTSNIIDLLDLFYVQIFQYKRASVQLNSRWLKKVYGNNYFHMIQCLIEKNIIVLWKNYSVGQKSKKYKLSEEVKNAGYLSSYVNVSSSLETKKRKLRTEKEKQLDINEQIVKYLVNSLFKTTIDYEKAKEWLKLQDTTDNSIRVNLNNIERINNKDIYFGFDRYGRFHTNYTILKKEIRQNWIKINNNPIKELDINNSQPFFLWLLMSNETNIDYTGYDLDVLNGKIYDKITNITGKTRKNTKVEVFKILYGRNEKKKQSEEEKAFKILYPNVYQWIVNFKKDNKNYKILAQKLQKIESDFIFKIVIPEIMKIIPEVNVITIHDSIIFESQHYDTISKIWNKCQLDLSEIRHRINENS